MAHRIPSASASLDARRISALAVAFLAHAAAALLIALPLAATLERAAPRVIEASVLEQPPLPLPVPPEPEPMQRVRPPQALVPPPSSSVPVRPLPSVAHRPVASEPAATPTSVAIDPAPGAAETDTHAGAGNGESRILAYAGAFKLAYPRAALRRHAQGTVLLHVLVGADGVAQKIELSRSSGHRELDEAAREAVRRARFQPVLQGGVAVPAWGLVPIEFRLDRA